MCDSYSRSFPLINVDAPAGSSGTVVRARATLAVRGGASDWSIRAGAPAGTLASVRSEDEAFEACAEAQRVDLRHGSFWSYLARGFSGGTETEVLLSTERAWDIELRSGVSVLDADLRGIDVASIAVRGGVSGLVLALAETDRVVPIRIHGGLQNVFVTRPVGVPFGLAVCGGVSDLTLDASRFGAIGGRVDLNVAAVTTGGRGYVLEVFGGASTLVVSERSRQGVRTVAASAAFVSA